MACLRYSSLASIQLGFSALGRAGLDAAIPRTAERDVGHHCCAPRFLPAGCSSGGSMPSNSEELDADADVARLKSDQLVAYT